MTLPGLPDRYLVRARLFPALIGGAALVFAALYLIPWRKSFGLPHAAGTLAAAVLIYVLADLARRAGKRIEPRLFLKWGGKPSTSMLRHRDTTLDATKKGRYHAFLEQKLGAKAPTPRLEKTRAADSDAFYDGGGDWLRGQTRDATKFAILFEENITYGFRRNLLGLKRIVIAADAALILASAFVGYFKLADPDALGKLPIVAVVAAIHAGFFLLFVTEASVRQAADQYARQLLLSVEELGG